MSQRTFGQPIKRNEDPRLLTGQALFTDDVDLPGMLHVAFVRSDFAHADAARRCHGDGKHRGADCRG